MLRSGRWGLVRPSRLTSTGSLSATQTPAVMLEGSSSTARRSRRQALNTIFADATCNERLDGGVLRCPVGRQSVTLWFEEAELRNREVIVTNEAGEALTFACELDQLSGLWTCDISTEDLGTGNWLISPPPSLTPYRDVARSSPQEPSPSSTTTTTTPPSTSYRAPPRPPAHGASHRRVRRGPMAPSPVRRRARRRRGRGIDADDTTEVAPRLYVAVRAGEGEWSPEETVRRERRQAFAVDVDGRHPSIERTKSTSPDLALEANRRGISVAGRLVGAAR